MNKFHNEFEDFYNYALVKLLKNSKVWIWTKSLGVSTSWLTLWYWISHGQLSADSIVESREEFPEISFCFRTRWIRKHASFDSLTFHSEFRIAKKKLIQPVLKIQI